MGDPTKTDVEVVGDPDIWKLICMVSSKATRWMRTTKAMAVRGGILVHVSSVQGGVPSEALAFVPGASLVEGDDGMWEIVS